MAYDTATTKSQFLSEQLLGMIANGIIMFFMLAASFITAESLQEKLFQIIFNYGKRGHPM